ncbi:MAG: alpha/beta hydrolase, partial [Sulfuritalea sp.]|nr:alpha/beta hydrolase [Sulfuritalea sp.]
VPTLVIWGEADTALGTVLLDGLEELVPDLRIVRIPEGSHWIIHEQPQKVSAAIREFLAEA